jgi:hypothetical protein
MPHDYPLLHCCAQELTAEVGELQSVDGYMNIALEKCEEHVNGVKKRSYGDAFVRGNNGMHDSRWRAGVGD